MHANEAGLITDQLSSDESSKHILEGGYEICACEADPSENPAQNEAEAEWWADQHPFLTRPEYEPPDKS